MINAKVITEKDDNFIRTKTTLEVKGIRRDLVEEIVSLLKALEKEHSFELALAFDKIIMEDKNNEEA